MLEKCARSYEIIPIGICINSAENPLNNIPIEYLLTAGKNGNFSVTLTVACFVASGLLCIYEIAWCYAQNYNRYEQGFTI